MINRYFFNIFIADFDNRSVIGMCELCYRYELNNVMLCEHFPAVKGSVTVVQYGESSK